MKTNEPSAPVGGEPAFIAEYRAAKADCRCAGNAQICGNCNTASRLAMQVADYFMRSGAASSSLSERDKMYEGVIGMLMLTAGAEYKDANGTLGIADLQRNMARRIAELKASSPRQGGAPADGLKEAIAIVESEPELPGPMPDYMRKELLRHSLEDQQRTAVIATKQAILRRLRATLVLHESAAPSISPSEAQLGTCDAPHHRQSFTASDHFKGQSCVNWKPLSTSSQTPPTDEYPLPWTADHKRNAILAANGFVAVDYSTPEDQRSSYPLLMDFIVLRVNAAQTPPSEMAQEMSQEDLAYGYRLFGLDWRPKIAKWAYNLALRSSGMGTPPTSQFIHNLADEIAGEVQYKSSAKRTIYEILAERLTSGMAQEPTK